MTMVSSAEITAEDSAEIGYIGRIPVRNLWLLMLYASNLYRDIARAKKAVEDNPDDIPDLVAEILARQVARRLKRNLSFGYQTREAPLNRVRGRINHLRTEQHQLLDRGMIACRFDELTVNTPRNRFVRAALNEIAKVVHHADIAHRCRSLAASLWRMGVIGVKPDRSESSLERVGRHDAADQQMLAAAHLAFNLALPTEFEGSKYLSAPDREITWIRRLYEKAIAGFYDVALASMGWRVKAGKMMSWPMECQTSGIDKIFPSMRADIVLENAGEGRRIVIDTKFSAIVTHGWHKEETLRSGHVFQIYAYLRSQEGVGDPLASHAEGILLHPAVGRMVNEAVVIQGHQIRFVTVDLGAEAPEIRKQLLQAIETAAFMGVDSCKFRKHNTQ